MKLKPLSDYVSFLETVQRCEGDVYFNSADSDHLNLKSIFCQFLFASVCKDRDYLERGSVECSESRDYQRLGAFLRTGS